MILDLFPIYVIDYQAVAFTGLQKKLPGIF